MEMVASSKMRRAVNGVLATRPYSTLAWEMILDVAKKTKVKLHPLLLPREKIKRVAVILVTSNRGLCGSFNQQAIKLAVDYIKKLKSSGGVAVDCLSLGSKGARTLLKLGYTVVADFPKADILNEVADIRFLSKMVTSDYLAEKYDRIVIVYTDFISVLRQIPRVKQLLPLESVADEMLGQVANHENMKTLKHKNQETGTEYLFEPNAKTILNELLPRLIEVQIYQAMLESNAAEHSARMAAMRNASDAASDMIDDLTLSYNQTRQAAITTEIAEIASGKAALE